MKGAGGSDSMAVRDALIKDAEHMEEAMERTVNRCDIWQDRIIYWLCVAVYHLLQIEIKKLEVKKNVSADG